MEQFGHVRRKCAPRRVSAMLPVGMTKASTTNALKTNARIKAISRESMVSLKVPMVEWLGGELEDCGIVLDG